MRQGVISGTHNIVCPLCFDGEEYLYHLFHYCVLVKMYKNVWYLYKGRGYSKALVDL